MIVYNLYIILYIKIYNIIYKFLVRRNEESEKPSCPTWIYEYLNIWGVPPLWNKIENNSKKVW